MKGDYILGFLACDGHLDSNGLTFGLQIQERDRQVLDLLLEVYGLECSEVDTRILKGRSYVRRRIHQKQLWEELHAFLGGRLKADRLFPRTATIGFVTGCFDADGSFYMKQGAPCGEFQHKSVSFTSGLSDWLVANDIQHTWRRRHSGRTVNILVLSAGACQKLAELTSCVTFRLARKWDVASFKKEPHPKYWTPEAKAWLRSDRTNEEIAILSGRSVKAIVLRRWKLRTGKCL